jgi:tRNA threonylcarbamoyladenosine biosynthesis protein TsaE
MEDGGTMPELTDTLRLSLPDPAATARLGAAVAAMLRPGDALLLSGPLGAGKSALARGLIRALASEDEEAPSPTFTLVQLYETPSLRLAHLDLYRLEHPEEADELGIDDVLTDGAAVIEWPERLDPRALPPNRLAIEIAIEGEGRVAALTPYGTFKGRVLGF